MTDVSDIEKIRKAVGRRVKFVYPPPEESRIGILRERSVILSDPSTTGAPYWDVVDLIEFPKEEEPMWVRIGYYRKSKDRLVFAGQTTITEPISKWKSILKQAAIEMPWFRNLLLQVVMELKNEGSDSMDAHDTA